MNKSTGLIVGLIIIPMLYILSIGPVGFILQKYHINEEPFRIIYLPIAWLHQNTLLKEPLEWYVTLFIT
jgi:hypothetical protein